jgi:EmrB/QacA subfamily drug resistance transporter
LADRKSWLALYVLCLGVLMIVLDTTVVTVALPSIQANLRFTAPSLIWVLNGYMLTFGGFLLLGGRLGDLYGQRRWFLIGLGAFTLASLACGLSQSRSALIVARSLQGFGGAVVTAVSLSLIMTLFTDAADRARAMGVYGFICAAGGSIGELLGGFLTKALGWHWIFLINIPIGLAVYLACARLLEPDRSGQKSLPLDIIGATLVTAALLLAVYAVVNANALGWLSVQTLGTIAVAATLLLSFLWVETKVSAPLMPLRLFRARNMTMANVLAVLWSAGMFAWFVITALYLQRVLRYDPLQVGLAFLPADVIMAAFSAGLSARLVMRFGIRGPLWVGLLIATAGLALFSRAPLQGSFVVDVLPGMLLLGLGAGLAFNPLLLAAMQDADASESGLASGIVNTSFMMGGALGLAILASVADAQTDRSVTSGMNAVRALNAGYHLAFAGGAVLTAMAGVLGALLVRSKP